MKIRFPDREPQNQGTFWGLWVQIDMGDVLVLGFGRWTAHFSKAPSLAGGLHSITQVVSTSWRHDESLAQAICTESQYDKLRLDDK